MNKNFNEQDVINYLFDKLDNWRHHPKYQLERRVDLFFSLYLKEVLKEKFKDEKDFCMADVLIPEFPVRKGTIRKEFKEHPHRNMSYNIDYLTTCKDSKNIIFVELKTDQKSINKRQTDYLEKTMETDFNLILEGIKELCKATKAKDKYYCLLKELQSLGLISNLEGLVDLMENAKYNGRFPQKEYQDLINNIEITNENHETHLVVIQPKISDSPKDNNKVIITFDDFIRVVNRYNDVISGRFKISLERWVSSEAGLKYDKKQ